MKIYGLNIPLSKKSTVAVLHSTLYVYFSRLFWPPFLGSAIKKCSSSSKFTFRSSKAWREWKEKREKLHAKVENEAPWSEARGQRCLTSVR